MPSLYWLPDVVDWRSQLRSLAAPRAEPPPSETALASVMALANARLDFVQTNALDEVCRRLLGDVPPAGLSTKPVRLAILGSSTLAHLHAAIRVAGLRRGLWINTYENDYGQYLQELLDPNSELHAFQPTAVLFAFDARHLTAGITASMSAADAEAAYAEAMARVRKCWQVARNAFRCPVLQQTILNVMPPLMGSNEHRLPGSRAGAVARMNIALRGMADAEGVDLIALDTEAERHGLMAWHDPGLWHRSKQEISPAAAPMYGELVGRLLAAKQGRSYKCLVLDLDNTIWGGIVGDDGLDGIVLGQGSGLGEGFVAVQDYARELNRRGIILAVCSKNDKANAQEPFEKHPEMVLRSGDIVSFRADWNDKAGNIRAIAEDLNIGLDSLVFLDDNPFERTLIRQELPMVAVPEAPEDPAFVAQMLADAGYFESVAFTDEDRERSGQYQENKAREELKASTTDMEGYLRSLSMKMVWRRFDKVGLPRIVQLINKTNQFNLTTRRYTEDDVTKIMDDPGMFGLQIRLLDRFGDNGIISIVIGKIYGENDLLVETWLMSCRVLGRQVELTTLNLIVAEAKRLGAERVVGQYIPTKKNGMVKDHYARLGFVVTCAEPDGASVATLDLHGFAPAQTFINVVEG